MGMMAMMVAMIGMYIGHPNHASVVEMISTAPIEVCEQLKAGVRLKIHSPTTGNSMFVDTSDWGIKCGLKS